MFIDRTVEVFSTETQFPNITKMTYLTGTPTSDISLLHVLRLTNTRQFIKETKCLSYCRDYKRF
jgi:hypothetical protein